MTIILNLYTILLVTEQIIFIHGDYPSDTASGGFRTARAQLLSGQTPCRGKNRRHSLSWKGCAKRMCFSEKRENSDSGHDVGRLINTLSHQLKRQMCIHEGEDSLTTNMQRLVLHYILFQSLERDIYQKDVEKEFQIRRSTATGTLQILEKNGFIIREQVKQDARLKKLVPTEKARGVRQHILGNIRYIEELLARGIPEEKLSVCREVLEQMSANLSGDEKRREEITDHE